MIQQIETSSTNPQGKKAVQFMTPFSNFPTFPFRSRSQYIFAELNKLFNLLPRHDFESMTCADDESNDVPPVVVSCGYTGMIQYVFHN
eukprot:gnl/Chilomastix_caulleri/5320.p1 GENE.gnl/Chilomastix_caulleri/5320~~gnl/Chilomastix_caulleri/5320.p1  ORF type:complete len:88 (-),score=15.30 gnl/Chilomastix_caulleri/5320:30-293(-)